MADADDGTFGLDVSANDPGSRAGGGGRPDPCRVILSFADGNAPTTVRFGVEGEGGVYGTVDTNPEVFVAPHVASRATS